MKRTILIVVVAFFLGVFVQEALTQTSVKAFESPTGNVISTQEQMPQDRIKETQIQVFSDKVLLDIDDPQWSTFTPTKSMVPFLDKGANAIQVAPEQGCPTIQEGDIISYESTYMDGVVIHRVVDTGMDENGQYFIAKGDNNAYSDPGKIRCDQIKRVLVAIIY
jgi:signal peptidase I